MKNEQLHDSSSIEKSIFDDVDNTIEIHFKNGSIYEYSDFDKNEYDAFINASSQGEYFARNIKNNFAYTKM